MTGPGGSGWPLTLRLVRHGESAGNVARDRAELEGLEVIEIDERDIDVGLSPLGERQAMALGSHIARQHRRLTVIWSSPYRRAADTAALLVTEGRFEIDVVLDERLRERAGAGRLQIALAAAEGAALAVAVPEAKVITLGGSDRNGDLSPLRDALRCADAVLVGSGATPTAASHC